jgi:hypothetical protein
MIRLFYPQSNIMAITRYTHSLARLLVHAGTQEISAGTSSGLSAACEVCALHRTTDE